ncbi:MAG: xanthine phosphoribosyltransferase [Oscillospiraceae bacterium]|nr:xanthine phosphoribosyltransferase [Oscillospiraceae bacterium]
MQLMKEIILTEGVVLPGGILKVGSFLNQQIDVRFLREIGREIARLYAGEGVNKILTVESSGIAIATAVALEMDVPLLFAKKHKSSNVDGAVLSVPVHSFTHNNDYHMMVSRDYLGPGNRVLLVDDFLANGAALEGLIALTRSAGADLVGAAIAIEKVFQKGGRIIREQGVRVESLAMIESMDDGKIIFAN